MPLYQELRIFSGTANPELARKIAAVVGVPLGKAQVTRFADGEIFVEIDENVRGMDVFIIQPTCTPTNEHLMELLIMIDALKRASADRITAVIPYYGYARQDRKVQPRTPITSKLVADLLTAAGAQRILAMDLHAGQIQGFFNIPFDHLYALPVFMEYLKKQDLSDNLVMVTPDAGGAERARAYAKRFDADLALIDKRRPAPNQAEVMNVVGDVKGKTAVIVDDIVDTAGTLTLAAGEIRKQGASRILAMCTHGVFSGQAAGRITESPIEALVVTDSLPVEEKRKQCKKLVVLSIANLLGEAIRRIHTGDSVSSLFV